MNNLDKIQKFIWEKCGSPIIHQHWTSDTSSGVMKIPREITLAELLSSLKKDSLIHPELLLNNFNQIEILPKYENSVPIIFDLTDIEGCLSVNHQKENIQTVLAKLWGWEE
jgi:hypothetical protein